MIISSIGKIKCCLLHLCVIVLLNLTKQTAKCKIKKIFITTECLKIRTPVFLFIYLFLNTLIEKFQKVQIEYKDQFQQWQNFKVWLIKP